MKKVFLFVLILFTLSFNIVIPVKAVSYASDTLKGNIVTEGDGLYKDSTVNGRYVYKGGNPNNFINFNNELWRIISVEKDGTLKIIKANPLDNPTTNEGQNVTFNDDKSKNYGTFCAHSGWGCNVWAKTEYFSAGFSGSDTSIIYYDGTVTEDSLINRYLNNEYYNNLSDISSCEIINKDYYFGPVGDFYLSVPVKDTIVQEKRQVWNGNIALPSVSDVILASTNETTCGTLEDINDNYYSIVNGKKIEKDCTIDGAKNTRNEECYNNCADTNWLMPSKTYKFTDYNYLFLNSRHNDHSMGYVLAAAYQGITDQAINSLYDSSYNNTFNIRPVTYLRSGIQIVNGDGSENDPYEFKFDECHGTITKENESLVVNVPSTSMFISCFIIGGFILVLILCFIIYLRVFKKDINK